MWDGLTGMRATLHLTCGSTYDALMLCTTIWDGLTDRGLPDLAELDLDGNPCSQSRGYKHRVLRCCPRLRELDGEELGQLDRDLSCLFFEEKQVCRYLSVENILRWTESMFAVC